MTRSLIPNAHALVAVKVWFALLGHFFNLLTNYTVAQAHFVKEREERFFRQREGFAVQDFVYEKLGFAV